MSTNAPPQGVIVQNPETPVGPPGEQPDHPAQTVDQDRPRGQHERCHEHGEYSHGKECLVCLGPEQTRSATFACRRLVVSLWEARYA